MPEAGKRAEMEGVDTGDFAVVRVLLTQGRAYEQAVEPCRNMLKVNQAAQAAMAAVVAQAGIRKKCLFLFVNKLS
jgi:hypothetical protein